MAINNESNPGGSERAPFTSVVCSTSDTVLAERLSATLGDESTVVAHVGSLEALEAIESPPDVLVLDASQAEMIAPRTLLRIRRRWPTATVLVLNVDTEASASGLLDAGVDDAIEARCAWLHAAARLSAATRRSRTANALLRRRVGDVVYDRESRRVWCAGSEITLAPRELAVLDCLWWRAGDVVGHNTLLDFVWSEEPSSTRSNRVEVYISYLRRKLSRSSLVSIETVRGMGYRLGLRSITSAESADTPTDGDAQTPPLESTH